MATGNGDSLPKGGRASGSGTTGREGRSPGRAPDRYRQRCGIVFPTVIRRLRAPGMPPPHVEAGWFARTSLRVRGSKPTGIPAKSRALHVSVLIPYSRPFRLRSPGSSPCRPLNASEFYAACLLRPRPDRLTPRSRRLLPRRFRSRHAARRFGSTADRCPTRTPQARSCAIAFLTPDCRRRPRRPAAPRASGSRTAERSGRSVTAHPSAAPAVRATRSPSSEGCLGAAATRPRSDGALPEERRTGTHAHKVPETPLVIVSYTPGEPAITGDDVRPSSPPW